MTNNARASGLLLPVMSLPSYHGIGDLGPEAYRFVDALAEAGQRYWQILPLNETLPGNNSPYHSVSAYAGDWLLISPEQLAREGFVDEQDLTPRPDFPEGAVDYDAVREHKGRILKKAFENFQKTGGDESFRHFTEECSSWLSDYCLFKALIDRYGWRWTEWPEGIRDRDPAALRTQGEHLGERIREESFRQYLFLRQWRSLKGYCAERGVRIIGDMAIYVELQSVDVWRNPELFKLGSGKAPLFVSGVPPDYFSSTGQLWGHPVYNWENMRAEGFDWWVRRIEHNLGLYDMVRIDHFRGFVGYWEVEAGETTAMNGRWIPVPAEEFFSVIASRFEHMPFIAEDLGVITADVTEAMDRLGIPGMKVLLFAFGEDNPSHPYLPHNYGPRCVVYTGTHDTNTARGWLDDETSPEDRRRLFDYLGRDLPPGEVPRELVRLTMASVADTAIVPVQDILGLGGGARLNRPGIHEGNYLWRLRPGEFSVDAAAGLAEMTSAYGRWSG